MPYMNDKDCSNGFCSLYCPHWCYGILSPPPPLVFLDGDGDGADSSPNFSPLVIAIIGILASAFLLVSYYTIISKYCGNSNGSSRGRMGHQNHDQDGDYRDDQNLPFHEPWHVGTSGLDAALIKSISVCKYKKGDGLVQGTECSVCLGEFQEEESLKLLPKCSHAFHVPCIDTWLKSHSNCPLCRANIFFVSVSSIMTPTLPLVIEITPHGNAQYLQDSRPPSCDHNSAVIRDDHTVLRVCEEEKIENYSVVPSFQIIRRAASMDHPCHTHHTSIEGEVN